MVTVIRSVEFDMPDILLKHDGEAMIVAMDQLVHKEKDQGKKPHFEIGTYVCKIKQDMLQVYGGQHNEVYTFEDLEGEI